MHYAPSVHYPVGRSAFWGALLGAFWLLGALLVGTWCYTSGSFEGRHMLGVAAVLVAGIPAGVAWWMSPTGTLVWDGQHWLWVHHQKAQDVQITGVLGVALDLQQHMLLRLQADRGAAVWLCAERSAFPARWLDLRRAVYSRASTDAPTAGISRQERVRTPSAHDRSS